jgi:hypothetical protein
MTRMEKQRSASRTSALEKEEEKVGMKETEENGDELAFYSDGYYAVQKAKR